MKYLLILALLVACGKSPVEVETEKMIDAEKRLIKIAFGAAYSYREFVDVRLYQDYRLIGMADQSTPDTVKIDPKVVCRIVISEYDFDPVRERIEHEYDDIIDTLITVPGRYLF